MKEDDSVIRIPTPSGTVEVGGKSIVIVAGPCAIETHDPGTDDREAMFLAAEGRIFFRGGAYKPRTSSIRFSGTGRAGTRKLWPKSSRSIWIGNCYRGD